MNENCGFCGDNAVQFCSACKLVKYCGAEHQKKHWKIHKLECRPFAVGSDSNLGRFLYATRDIQSKDVIFTELPMVIGPKWYLNEREEYTPVVPCVGCYTPCRIGVHSCPRCHWPVCVPTCAGLINAKLHAFECPILMLGPGPERHDDPKSLLDYYRTDALIVLKCLLLQWNTPKKWTDLMNMQSHEIEREGSDLYQEAEKRIVSYLETNYLGRLKSLQTEANRQILTNCDTKLLRRICGIIETNYMCINLLTGLELSGIFFTACLMEHSCMPNCYFTFDHSNGYKISIIAGCDIKKGEHLKIMYSNMLWGTQVRQVHLNMTKHFTCHCERCLDPTELGTYLSALKCIGTNENSPCDGIHLADNPISEKIEWKCNKCTANVSDDTISTLISEMGEEVNNVLSVKPTIKQLEELINKLSSFLHENHYHLFGLKHCLIQLYGTQSGYKLTELSEDLIDKKFRMCEQLLSVCDKLDPFVIRLSIYVSVILLEMNSVLVEQGKRKALAKILNEPEQSLKLARGYLTRASEILQKELDNIGGSKLHEAVLKAIANVENLLLANQ